MYVRTLSFPLPVCAVMCRRARWSVSPFPTCSKSSSPQPPGFSFLSCAELQRIQSMKARPNLQGMVKYLHAHATILMQIWAICFDLYLILHVLLQYWQYLCLCDPGLVGPAPTSVRWTCLMLDLQYTLSIYLNRCYSHLKSIKLCANMAVKNMFTSDLLLDPGETLLTKFTSPPKLWHLFFLFFVIMIYSIQ